MNQDKKCPSCGATMIFNPGFDSLICQSCGHKEVIPELVSKVPVEEMDFLTAQNTASHDWGMEAKLVQCRQCGAETIQRRDDTEQASAFREMPFLRFQHCRFL